MNAYQFLAGVSLACAAGMCLAQTTQSADDAALIAETAANRGGTPSGSPMTRVAGVQDFEEAEARADLALARARLESLLARKALQRGETDRAARHAGAVLEACADFPAGHPAAEECETFELIAHGVLTRASAAGVQAGAHDARHGVSGGHPRTSIARQSALRDLTAASHVEALVEAQEALVVPRGDYNYPADWAAIAARRARYAGGQIARTESTTDAEGREMYTAVYDVSDLIYVPPNFESGWIWDMNLHYRDLYDRMALRQRSWIFGGPAYELAAGIPLLHHFGGVGGQAGYYCPEQQRQVAEMIRVWTPDHPEARILAVPPR